MDYAVNINKSYLCLAGTSKYNYRLGKYVEIAMCGSVVLGDLPYEDKARISMFTVEVNNSMSDKEILDKIKSYLDDKKKLNEMSKYALNWSKQYVTEKYNDILLKHLVDNSKYFKKITNNKK